MKILIIGAGSTGSVVANILGEEHEIVLIEKEEEIAKKIANKTNALIIHGDATDISILKEAGISEKDAVITTTSDDKTNLMVCEIAKGEKIKKIISLVNSPKNEELFAKNGFNSLVSVIGTNVTAIKRMLYQHGDERIIAQFGDGDLQIIEQTVSKNSKLIGNKAEIKDSVIAAIYRSGDLIIPNKETELKEGDVLLVAVKTKNLAKVAEVIKKE